MGWVHFLGESQSRIYSDYVCQIWLRLTVVSKKGGTDRQTDEGTLQLYIVDYDHDTDIIASLTVTGTQVDAFLWRSSVYRCLITGNIICPP